jgi:hypothetical protein
LQINAENYFHFYKDFALNRFLPVIYCLYRELAAYNMNLEHTTPELFAALAKAQNAVENAHKGSLNPHFKNRYADLAEVLNTVRPVFSECGLSIVQETSFDGSLVSVTTALCHEKGGYITAIASCVPAKADAQGVGAATTYLRRYSLAAVTGVAQEDDDGQSAINPVKANPVKSVAAPTVVYAITDDLIKLRKRMTYLQVNEASFLTKLGIESISTMPSNKVQLANDLLDKKEEVMRNKAAMSMAKIEPEPKA